jgi:hypothetical protein
MHVKTELFLIKEAIKETVHHYGAGNLAVWPGSAFVLLGISLFQHSTENTVPPPTPAAISSPARPQSSQTPAVTKCLPCEQPRQ